MPDQEVLVRLHLTGCPIGTVFACKETDRKIEEGYFSGWCAPLSHRFYGMPSCFRVIKDGKEEALEHIDTTDRCLVAGSEFWRDYTVSAKVRQIHPYSKPFSQEDEILDMAGKSGVMFRYHDLRHYYFLCLESYQKAVLYRREDRNWSILEEQLLSLDRNKYYELKVEVCKERILCSIDEEKMFDVRDSVFLHGKVGIRTNTISRFKSILVTASARAAKSISAAKKDYEHTLEQLRGKYPQPVLWKRIPKSKLGFCYARFGNIYSSEEVGVVLFAHRKSPNTPDLVTGMDLDGSILWQIKESGNTETVRLCDIDGDGREEIICVRKGKLQILDGATGRVQEEKNLPLSGPFIGHRREPVEPTYGLYVVNLRGKRFPQDIVIHDGGGSGGNTLWAFDEKLNLLWNQTVTYPCFGHHIDFYDVDGDGREEIIAGYYLLNSDGEIIWRMEGAEYIEYEEHVDSEAIGRFSGTEGNGIQIAMVAGSEGFFLVDALTGKVLRRHRLGHAQGLWIGNFRKDLPGLEILVGNRWGSYGILTLISGTGEKLFSFEPDNISQGGPPTNWSGDGEELIFLAASKEAFGLFDAWGRKVVKFQENVVSNESFHHSMGWQYLAQNVTGDARDELLLIDENAIYIFTQDRPFKGERIYAPIRKRRLETPVVSLPDWKQVS